MKWHIVDTGTQSAEKNMELDARLLHSLDGATSPILHFYDWEAPSATYGYFTDPAKHLKKSDLQLARRPTGGGIIFHLTDFAFSLLVPASHPNFSKNTLENYVFVNGIVSQVIASVMGGKPILLENEAVSTPSPDFCMANPTIYDVMINGKKVGGAAQRQTKHGFLHQGSIFLSQPSDAFLESVLLDTSIIAAMKANSFPLLQPNATPAQIRDVRQLIKAHFI